MKNIKFEQIRLGREAPFSGLYKGFYFVPLYALEHMYYGVSNSSLYVGLEPTISTFKKDFPAEFHQYSEFYPKVNFHLPSEFNDYLCKLIDCKINFLGFKPYTYYYNLFVGIFLYFVWKFGGGYRISPLYDPEKEFSMFGFYDLRLTPLAVIFKLYFKLNLYLKGAQETRFKNYYYFNKRSLTRGYFTPLKINNNLDCAKDDFFAYCALPIIVFLPEFFLVTFYHFFLRSLYYRYTCAIGTLLSDYIYKQSFLDGFWMQLYLLYIKEVCSVYRMQYPNLRLSRRLKYSTRLAVYFYLQNFSLQSYYARRRRHLFSVFGYYELGFKAPESAIFFRKLELKKINHFKTQLLVDSSFDSYNFESSFFLFLTYRVKSYAKIITNYIYLDNRKYYVNLQNFSFILDWLRIEIKRLNTLKVAEVYNFEKYENLPGYIKFVKSRFKYFFPVRVKYPIFSIFSVFRDLFVQFAVSCSNTLLLVVYFTFYPIYSRLCRYFSFLTSLYVLKAFEIVDFTNYSFVEGVRRFYLQPYFSRFYLLTAFNLTFKFVSRSIQFISKLFKLYVTAVHSVYKLFRNFIYLVYLELFYISIFLVEYIRYFKVYLRLYYYYSSIKDYFDIFKKYFISTKFFRFFTREVAEDLEETPFNNPYSIEEEYLSDYLNTYPAYYDLQDPSEYDQGFLDDQFIEEFDNSHYYDYWTARGADDKFHSFANPNLEFFGDDHFEEETDYFLQILALWVNPSLSEISSSASEQLPYQEKDSSDDNWLGHRDLFSLETNQSEDYDEDHIEYYMDSSYDEHELSETFSMLPVPFDADRSRLYNFTKQYRRKLDKWHSYQLKNNFVRLPDVLRTSRIPAVHQPVKLEQWRQATIAMAKFILPKREAMLLQKSEFDSIQSLDKVWGRISYEIDRNPRKLHEFLDHKSSEFDVFKNLFFTNESSINLFSKIFGSALANRFGAFYSSRNSTHFLDFLFDYFNGYTDFTDNLKSTNENYCFRGRYDILYSAVYFKILAETNFQTFYNRFATLSQHKQFKELTTSLELIAKYSDKTELYVADRGASKEQIYHLRYVYFLTATHEFVHPYKKPLLIDRINLRAAEYYRYSYRYIFGKFPRGFKKRWLAPSFKPAGHINRRAGYSDSETSNEGYETAFSLFLEDAFFSIRNLSRKFTRRMRSRFFRGFKPPGSVYYLLDGEDYMIRRGELSEDKLKIKRRTYFYIDQLIEGDVWNTLNPFLDELFYELYYLNSNLFFPTFFSDNLFEEVLPDDEINSGQDIYDEYIYLGAADDQDRAMGSNRDDLTVAEGELLDEDPETLDSSDEDIWSDEGWDDRFDEGLIRGHETGGEAPDAYNERFWYNSDWYFKVEHFDNDEGLEEWEPDEYESAYDVDMSVDRFFFGGLKRNNTFPATDQRLFLGSFSEENSDLDKDLDYAHNFEIARANSEAKSLVVSGIAANKDLKKNYFSAFRFSLLAVYRAIVYIFYYLDYFISTVFRFPDSNYVDNLVRLELYFHYVKWYEQYNAFYNYKTRLEDWLKFFETFSDPKIFKNYKDLNTSLLISEPQNVDFKINPYGRFWLQYPFNNHINEFASYTHVNLFYTSYLYQDLLFKTKNGRPYLSAEQIDEYTTEFPAEASLTGGVYDHKLKRVYKTVYRFFASDPWYADEFVRNQRRKKLDKITAYPWFSDRSRYETVGSDFTYMDFNFIDDMPEDDEFPEYHIKNWLTELSYTYNYKTGFYFNWFEKTRSGASPGHFVPNDGILDGLGFEETDWDIGSMVSFSTDEFNSHVDEFSEKLDIFISAIKDFFELFLDYTNYYFGSKFRKFILIPYKYWEITSNSRWLELAAQYGVWVLVFRNIFNTAIFVALFIYGFFIITRLLYLVFGEYFNYGFFSFLIFISTAFYMIVLFRLLFKSANDFYKSVTIEEKVELFALFVLTWYFHVLNGHMRSSVSIWAPKYSPDMVTMLSNTHTAQNRRIGTDYTMFAGFTHRPEINKQGWIFRRGAPLKSRTYHKHGGIQYEPLAEDRRYFWYNYSFTPYPTYFNPYNLFHILKQKIFNLSNENLVGYYRFKKSQEKYTVRMSRRNSHKIIHRPEAFIWPHMNNDEADEWIKEQIVDQSGGLIFAKSPYLYRKTTSDRFKYNNISFTNPINQRPYAVAPANLFNIDKPSRIPYDFRPKFLTPEYSDSTNYKLNSNFANRAKLIRINATAVQPNNKPYIHYYESQSLYELPEIRKGKPDFGETIQESKYKNPIYKAFRNRIAKSPFQSSFYENSVRTNWLQNNIFDHHFNYQYAVNLRKYLFWFNPQKAQPLREIYGLAYRDVVPYPDHLILDKGKRPKLYFSEVFRNLSKRERQIYFATVQLENLGSAATVLTNIQLKSPPYKTRIKYPLYSQYYTTPPIYIDNIFYYDFEYIFETLMYDMRNLKQIKYPKIRPPEYSSIKTIREFSRLKVEFDKEIGIFQLSRIDELTGFFSSYVDYRNDLISIIDDSDKSLLSQVHKRAYANRLRRSVLLNSYFRSAKSFNKSSIKDYYREAYKYINPYSYNRFYNFAKFRGYLEGLSGEKAQYDEEQIYHPFASRDDKSVLYQSELDDRTFLSTADIGYKRPVYETLRRKQLRFKRIRYLNRFVRRYGLDPSWNKKKLIENPQAWDFALDAAMIQDLEREPKETLLFPESKEWPFYKFHGYFLDKEDRVLKILGFQTKVKEEEVEVDSKNLVVVKPESEEEDEYEDEVNFRKGREFIRPEFTFADYEAIPDSEYTNHEVKSEEFMNEMFTSVPVKYNDHEIIEDVGHYSFRDQINGIKNPAREPNRLNFMRSNIFYQWRIDHWIQFHKDATPYERHKKPFVGVGNIDQTFAMRGGKMRAHEYRVLGYLANNQILDTYTWYQILQRAKMQYPPQNKDYSLPYNEHLQILHELDSKEEHEDYYDNFTKSLTEEDREALKGKLVRRIPFDFSDYTLSPKISGDFTDYDGESLKLDHDNDLSAFKLEEIEFVDKLLALEAADEKARLYEEQEPEEERDMDDEEKMDEWAADIYSENEFYEDLKANDVYEIFASQAVLDALLELEEVDKDQKSEASITGQLQHDEDYGRVDTILRRAKTRRIVVTARKGGELVGPDADFGLHAYPKAVRIKEPTAETEKRKNQERETTRD